MATVSRADRLGGVLVLRILLCATVVLSGAAVGRAQEWARKMFETTSHDFGTVARGAKAEFRFKLSNIYLEEVHIKEVRSGCKCTIPSIERDTLATYDEGAILATFNTRAFIGQRKATVTVVFDKPSYAEVQLQVTGYIRSDIVVEPGEVAFGTVDASAAIERIIKISYDGRPDWEISEIRSSSEFVEAEAVETQHDGAKIGYDMTVRLLPGAPPGYLKEQLTLVTNDARAAEVPIDVEGRVLSGLTVSPPSLFIGALKPGQKVKKTVVVQAKQPFRITAINCDHDCLEFTTPKTASRQHAVPLTFTAGETPGRQSFTVDIDTDLPGNVTTELPVQAHVVEAE